MTDIFHSLDCPSKCHNSQARARESQKPGTLPGSPTLCRGSGTWVITRGLPGDTHQERVSLMEYFPHHCDKYLTLFLPCLLTRFSKSKDSWLKTKTKLPHSSVNYNWNYLLNKISVIPWGDTGKESSWVCKDYIWMRGTHIYAASTSVSF